MTVNERYSDTELPPMRFAAEGFGGGDSQGTEV